MKHFLCFNKPLHTASCLLHTEEARNWYDRVNAVNYQLWFTWLYHFVLLVWQCYYTVTINLVMILPEDRNYRVPSQGRKPFSPLPLCTHVHTQAHTESAAGAYHRTLLSFILKPTGASRDFPPCALAGGYFCSLIKKIRDDHRGRPRWACVRLTNDKWRFYRVADDWFDQLKSQGPSTTCQVGDCSFCNNCVHEGT